MRPTVMEIDTKAFMCNIKKIKKHVGNKEIMPVIKANGYGTHINFEKNLINNFNIVGVATIDEAIELRCYGYLKDIFLLNQPAIEDIYDIINFDITIGISEKKFIKELLEQPSPIKVHLEIETGMNRTGIKPEDLDKTLKQLEKNPNIVVEGVYTHLSSADKDKEYTLKQLNTFKECVDKIKSKIPSIKYIHSQASNGLLNYDDGISNMVRPGILIYGYESFPGAKDIIDVKPISTLKTKVIYLKTIGPEESVSYGRTFISKKEMKVATIPIGYADGFRRELSNKGYVVINKQKAPIIGNICMDSCMVDVTDIPNVRVGSDVYIWDNKIITLEDVAKECNTINYEILSCITNRVARVFKGE